MLFKTLKSSVGSVFGMHFLDVTNAEVYGFEPQNHQFGHFLTISVFWLLLLHVFLFFEFFLSFRIFFLFYTKHENNQRSSSLGSD